MDKSPDIKLDSSAASHHSTDANSSIINRPRETKGLPNSFSSNLNSRASPNQSHRANNAAKDRKRTVKSIVAWIENSPKERPSRGGGSGGERLKPSKSAFSVGTVSSQSSSACETVAAQAEDIEEYSLTLLKYRQYFTEAPLARCLDRGELGEDDEMMPGILGYKDTADDTVRNSKRDAPLNTVDCFKASSLDMGSDVIVGNHEPRYQRDPEEVQAF